MEINNWGINLIIILLVIMLLLVIGILALCLWSLLLILKKYLDASQNMGERNNDGKKEETLKSIGVPIKEEVHEEKSKESDENVASKNVNRAEQQNSEKNAEQTTKDIRAIILEFIQHSLKDNCVRLKVINKLPGNYLEEFELIQDTSGKLVIFQEDNQRYIVVPESENIGEKEYEYCGMKECYETDPPVKSGCYYRIIQVLEPCIVRKCENNYLIESKGKLKLEQK